MQIQLTVGIVLLAFNLRAAITALGPLTGMIIHDTGLSLTAAGLITTLPLLAFAAFSVVTPKIARQIGTEKSLCLSMFLLTVGIWVRSHSSVPLLFVGTAIIGVAIAVGNVLLPSLIKQKIPQKIGLMTSLYSTAMGTFAALASGISIPLAVNMGLGWKKSLLCWSILAIIAFIIFIPQFNGQKQVQSLSGNSGKVNLWKSKLAWQVTLYMGLQSFGFYCAIAWFSALLQSKGMSGATSGWLLSLMQVISLPVTFLVPILAGRLKDQRVIVTGTVVALALGYICMFISLRPVLVLGVLLVGIGQGASISLALILFGLRTQHADNAARLSGMAQSVGYALAAIGPALFGFLYDFSGQWTLSLSILVFIAILQLLVGWGAGRNLKIDIEKNIRTEDSHSMSVIAPASNLEFKKRHGN